MRAAGVTSYVLDGAERAIELGRAVENFEYELAPVGRRPHRFVTTVTLGMLGPINLAKLHLSAEAAGHASGAEDTYFVGLPHEGSLHLGLGRSQVTADPDHAAVIGPIDHVAFHGWHSGTEHVSQLTFSRQALSLELSRLIARDVTTTIRFSPELDLRHGLGAHWRRLVGPALSALDEPESLVWHPLSGASLSSAILSSLLLAGDHNYRDALEARSRPTTPSVVRRAVAYIDERAHEPITVPMVAAAVGCSVRTLQRGFREHLDSTPLAYLMRVRLDRAHHELVSGTPETTSVAEVGSRWGFEHLGHFAANYRSVYGTVPSATLRDDG